MTAPNRIDHHAWGTCQWAFCNAGGTVTIDATRRSYRGHRSVTHIFNACAEHELKVVGELEGEGYYKFSIRERGSDRVRIVEHV